MEGGRLGSSMRVGSIAIWGVGVCWGGEEKLRKMAYTY